MIESFPQMVTRYGSAELIPDSVLGEWLYVTEVRNDLINRAKMGVTKIPESDLGKEVRRRAKSNLAWLVCYFLWDASPTGFGRPLSDNGISVEYYRPMFDLFVQKDDSKSIVDQDLNFKSRFLLWPRGGRKALDLVTKLPTPDGFVTMGDVRTGDVLFDEEGKQCRVTDVGPVYYDRPCYEVEFSTGEVFVADEGHLWVTDSRGDRESKRPHGLPRPVVRTTKEVQKTLLRRGEHNHRVSVSPAVELEEKIFPIHPYVLGAWLGDGTSAAGSLTGVDEQIIEECRRCGEVVSKSPAKFRWVFNGGKGHPTYRKRGGSLAGRLRKLGVLNNKHIPQVYLRGSFEQRLSLLQGLMDTDGGVSRKGSCRFENTNEKLTLQVKELAASLGFKPTFNIGKAVLDGLFIGPKYVVEITAYEDVPVFRLERKRKELQPRKKVSLQKYRQIVDIRPIETRPVRCIAVDSPSHTYLIGDGFIPTHNSTVDCCDAVQWVLNFPDIRILFLTAADGLAIGLVDELKGYFVIRPEEPSLMNLFFPEYCVEEKDLGNQFEFTCPLWAAKKVKRKEPTVMAASVGGTKSGWHYEVIKADDSVSDKNSETSDQCATIAKKIALAQDLLVVGGYYIDYIGTRYDDADFYGIKLEKDAIGDVVVTNPHPCITISENLSNRTKFMIAQAIKIKPEVAEQLRLDGKKISYKEAGEEGCDLLMPKVMSYKWLLSEWAREESVFEAQKNQNPTPPSAVTFDQATLTRCTVPYTEIPQTGMVTITWDFAFSFNKKKKGRDFATGCAVRWDREGRGYVLDLIREKFNTPTLLAQAVVDFAEKWRPTVIGIEAASGSQLAEPAIKMFAEAKKDARLIAVCSRIDWVTPENVIDAKRMRMAAIHPWLEIGRLKFVSHLPHLQSLYTEFKKCLTSKGHDDIPDVISRQLKYAPSIMDNGPVVPGADPFKGPQGNFDKKQAEWNIMFEEACDAFGRVGQGQVFMPIVDVVPETDVPTGAPAGLDPILGAGIFG